LGLTAGTRLGPYEVIEKVGAGGMGEVYRARDTRLRRDVAVKTLPDAFVSDPERIARFEREAQVLATLNHQHIGQIYGVEEIGAQRYFILEFIEGRSLSDVIRAGALPFAEALGLARQILDALETAHDQGIVHRDLKPANIMVRGDGVAKVLDFGLARVSKIPSGDVSDSPTKTAPPPTEAGVILGTAAYMSPEQARGQVADRRSDVWAFGCVFYEMLSGRRAFAGEGWSDTLAVVLRSDPDWSALPKDVPPGVRALVQRCLARDRKERVPEIAAVRFLLEDAVARNGAAADRTSSAAIVRPRERVWMAVAFLGAALGLSGGLMLLRRAPDSPTVVQFTMSPPDGEQFTPSFSSAAVSPDGQRIVFTTTTNNTWRLWQRNLDDRVARPVPGVGVASQLFWSPDSRRVAFTETPANGVGKLKCVDLASGRIQVLTEAAMGTGAWSASGVIVITGQDRRLHQLPESGGGLAPLTELDPARDEVSHWWPIFLPDGRRFLYQAISRDKSKSAWYLSSLDTPSTRTRIADGILSSMNYAQGRLFFQHDGRLMMQPFDERAGRLVGDPVEIADSVDRTVANGRALLSVSRTGTIVYRERRPEIQEGKLIWLDAQGKPSGMLGEPARYIQFSFSPDGRRLAVTRGVAAQSDIWTMDVERSVSTRLTSDPAMDGNPVWSPDGSTVYFSSPRTSVWDIYRREVGGTSDELVYSSLENKQPTSVSRDGVLLFDRDMSAKGKGLDIWALPLSGGGGQPFEVVATESNEHRAHFSPDGHWISYFVSDESGLNSAWVRPFPVTPRSAVQVSTETSGLTRSTDWSRDGKQIYYANDKTIRSVDLTSPGRPGPPRDIAPLPASGQWAVDPRTGRVLILDAPASTGASDGPFTVLVNWTAGLKK
jgi:serine/threonine protein kinase/Tol biopolymer transport system component